jgi:hypothetical protein
LPKLALLITLVAAVLAGPASVAQAAKFLPPGNKVFWGGQGGYSQGFIKDFARQSSKHPAIYNYFISWRASFSDMHWLGFRLDDAKTQRARVLLSVSPAGTGLTPGSIAKGKGDAFLVRLNKLIALKGEITYVRPMSEMNNANNPYSAYDQNGRSRGPAYSTRAFKQAWRRLALILRGGEVATINKKLKRLHLPNVKTGAKELQKSPIALAWVPLSLGNPEVAHNRPGNWWPGSAYVDWVGTTWYSPFRASSVMDHFYNSRPWRKKPFMFAEWGVWGADTPSFVGQFFGFLKSHRRVRAALYYQSSSLKTEFRLSSHPKSRAALRKAVKWSRLSGLAPEFAGR